MSEERREDLEKMEDKQAICNALAAALRRKRQFKDLLSLTYDDKSETVLVRFENGGMRLINVGLDSGYALIFDIVRYIIE